MSETLQVQLQRVDQVDAIPGRLGPGAVEEIALGLCDPPIGEDPWEAIQTALAPLTIDEAGELLLDQILVEPPIPAGCAALARAMAADGIPPWRTHEVVSDRVWLWIAHAILARVRPEDVTAPLLARVTLEVSGDPSSLPGRRISNHDKVAWAADCLRQAFPTLDALGGDAHTWAYDVLWAVEISGQGGSRTVAVYLDNARLEP